MSSSDEQVSKIFDPYVWAISSYIVMLPKTFENGEYKAVLSTVSVNGNYTFSLTLESQPGDEVSVKFSTEWMKGDGSFEGSLYGVRKSHPFSEFVWRNETPSHSNAWYGLQISNLKCDITFYNRKKILDVPESHFCGRSVELDSYEKILNDEKFSDVKIVTSGETFYAHKVILSARSRVFAAMFEHNMKESRENKILVEDVDSVTMKEVLRFIYAGKVENVENVAVKLICPAEKYELHGLINLCEKVIIDSLSTDNINKILLLVDLFNFDGLKKGALQFLVQNKTLLESNDFKEFMKKLSPALLIDVISLLSAKPLEIE